MIRTSVTLTGPLAGGAATRALGAIAEQVEDATHRIVIETGATLQTLVRAKASTGNHRPGLPHISGTGPGPNVATGDYRRSILRSTDRPTRGITVATVSSNAAQAWRLERGFVGRDITGRTYRQQPYPHWQPAVDDLAPVFAARIEAVIAAAVLAGNTLAGGTRVGTIDPI